METDTDTKIGFELSKSKFFRAFEGSYSKDFDLTHSKNLNSLD